MIRMTIYVQPLFIWFGTPKYIVAQMDETRFGVFNLIQSSLNVQV